MDPTRLSRASFIRAGLVLGLALTLLAVFLRPASAQQGYQQTNLVTDDQGNLVASGFSPALHVDPNLVNPWGMSFSASSPFWVSDNGTGFATLYNSGGTPQSLVVTIPPPTGSTGTSAPTGQVFNSTASDFSVTSGGKSGKALFLFDTEDGTVSGWSPGVNTTNAIRMVDNSTVSYGTNITGAVYKGLALGSTTGGSNLLFASNFRSGMLDVFDGSFGTVGSFTDTTLQADGYAPFGVQNVDGSIYVTFAKQDATRHDDVAGLGQGYVDKFDPNTDQFTRFASQGTLDSPWGLALAPSDFGTYSNDLLVGNFGDGLINAFDPSSGAFLGQLAAPNGDPIAVDGLWALNFGNGGNGGVKDQLYFTAGINGEQHGLFGTIAAVPEPSTYALFAMGLVPLVVIALRRRVRE